MTQGFFLTLVEQKLGPIAAERFASIGTRGHESINICGAKKTSLFLFINDLPSAVSKTAQVLTLSQKNFVPLAM